MYLDAWEDSKIIVDSFNITAFGMYFSTDKLLKRAKELGSEKIQKAVERYCDYGYGLEPHFLSREALEKNNWNLIEHVPGRGWKVVYDWKRRREEVEKIIKYTENEKPFYMSTFRETNNKASFAISFNRGWGVNTTYGHLILIDKNLKPIRYEYLPLGSTKRIVQEFEDWLKQSPVIREKEFKMIFEQAKESLLELQEQYQLEDLIRKDINHD